MKKTSLIIFDADGTLLDSMPGYAVLFGKILNRHYGLLQNECRDYMLSSAGSTLESQYKYMLQGKNVSDSKIQELIIEFQEKSHELDPKPFPDVVPALERLRDYAKVVSSSGKQDFIAQSLRNTGLLNYFDHCFGISQQLPNKIAHMEEIKRVFKMSDDDLSKKCIYVSDGPGDIKIGNSYKITTFGRVGTLSEHALSLSSPTFLIDRLESVVDYLEFQK